MYDALARHHAIELLVTRDSPQGLLRRYYRFRADRWYGGIATGDVVGCGLLCRFCWASDHVLERPDITGKYTTPDDAAQKLARIAESRHISQVRLSGGEPTIGRQHLLSLLAEVERAGRFRFILETNGILLGADPGYCSDLAAFRCLHVRVSLKGATEKEFEQLTGANCNGFELQIDALRNLRDAGVSSHPAVMYSFSSGHSIDQLRDRLATIEQRYVNELEFEELIRYLRVERRLQKYGLTAHVSHSPRHVPKHLI